MTEVPAFYAAGARQRGESQRMLQPAALYLVVGALAFGLGLAYSVAPGEQAPSSLHVAARPSVATSRQTISRLAAGAEEGEGPAEALSGEWPAHYIPPNKLAHPRLQREPMNRKASDSDSDMDATELISGDWPAHYPLPKKLAHPKPQQAKAAEAVVDATEVISGEWPAHFPLPKLAHPKQVRGGSAAMAFLLGVVAIASVAAAAVTGVKARNSKWAGEFRLMADQDGFAVPQSPHPFQPPQPGHGLSLATKEQLSDPEVDLTCALHAADVKARSKVLRSEV
eukprot:EG_transcript_18556